MDFKFMVKTRPRSQRHAARLQALPELRPSVIPERLTVTRHSFAAVTALTRKPRRPNKALRDLLSGKGVLGEL